MKSCTMILKDGRKITGINWDWKPGEGYMTVAAAQVDGVLHTDGPLRVNFDDIASGTTERSLKNAAEFREMERAGKFGNPKEDLLEYARQCGWDPKPACFDPATSPGMTDLMIAPENLDVFLKQSPLPETVLGFVEGASNETGVQVSGFRKDDADDSD